MHSRVYYVKKKMSKSWNFFHFFPKNCDTRRVYSVMDCKSWDLLRKSIRAARIP